MSMKALAEWNKTFQEMDGFGVCSGVIPWRTSDHENLEQLEPVEAKGNYVNLPIARKSITSFTGVAREQ